MTETDKLAKYVRSVLRLSIALFVAIIIAEYGFGFGTDDSDLSGQHRSGMTVYTDAATGCQYLGTRAGLSPRLTVSGKQKGCTR